MGGPFLHGGLRARVSSWPPLRLVRLRRERVSVGVVPSQRFPLSIEQKGVVGVVRYIGMDVHREFAQLAVVEDGLVRDDGRIAVTPAALRRWAGDLRADDQVALEATGNSDAIANLLTPIVGRVVVSNPSKTRAIAEAKVKTDKVDARILAQLLAADFLRRCGCRTIGPGRCVGRSPAALTWFGNGPGSKTRSMRSWPATWFRPRRSRICSAGPAGTAYRRSRCRPTNAPARRHCCGSWTSTAPSWRWWTKSLPLKPCPIRWWLG